MRKEIDEALLGLQIVVKEARRESVRNIAVVVILAIVFSLILYFFPQFNLLWVVFLFTIVLGGIVFLVSLETIYKPLKAESNAFRDIARAVQILEKSKEPIAYEEAYRCLKHAHKILKKIELDSLEWYNEINETLKQFLENLQLIVLPAIANSKIKKEHLEEIALAVLSINPSKIEAVNETLKSEPSYKKAKPPPRKMEIFASKFRESTYVIVLALIIGCCIFYYTVVNYLEISKEYALGASVVLFIGILTIYFRKQLKQQKDWDF